MTKIKPQLIIYSQPRGSYLSQNHFKKRLFISKLESYPLSLRKKIPRARICKYVSKTGFQIVAPKALASSFLMCLFHLFVLNSCKITLCLTGSIFDQLPMSQSLIITKFLKRQKRAHNLMLELPDKHPIEDLDVLKPLFRIRNIKEFHFHIKSANVNNFKLLHDLLQYLRRRKPWASLSLQKVTLRLGLERDMNTHIVQCSDELLHLKELLRETNTQLEISCHPRFILDSEPSKRLVHILSDLESLESLKRLNLCGTVDERSFQSALGKVKGLRTLEKIDFQFGQVLKTRLWVDPFKDVGEYLMHFSLSTACFDAKESPGLEFCTALKGLSKLKSFKMEISERNGTNGNFLIPLSDSLSAMTDLQSLEILFAFFGKTEDNVIKDGIERIFATIGGLVKLKKLSLQSGTEDGILFGIEPLCESLRKIRNLKSLEINWGAEKIRDKSVERLFTILPELEQLEEIFFHFSNGESLRDRTMFLIFKKMEELKRLRNVELTLAYSKITEEFVSMVVQTMRRLKSLKDIELFIKREFQNEDIETHMIEIMETFEKRIDRVTLDFFT